MSSKKKKESLLHVKPIVLENEANIPAGLHIWSQYLFHIPADQKAKLHHSRQELEEAAKNLKELRESKKFQELDRMWERLAQKQKDLKVFIEELKEFLAANKEKRARALDRIQESKQSYYDHCSKIRDIQAEFDALYKIKCGFEQEIRKMKIFEEYIESAIALAPTGIFKNPHHLISWYSRLIQCKQQNAECESRAVKSFADEVTGMRKALHKKATRIAELMGRIDLLQQRYFAVKESVLVHEEIVERAKKNITRVISEKAQVKECCDSIYKSICRRMNRQPIEGASVEYKLKKINDEMKFLKDLVIANQRQYRRSNSCRRTTVMGSISTIATRT